MDIPLPRRVPPPVTRTTLSLNVSGGSMVCFLMGKCLACGSGLYASLANDLTSNLLSELFIFDILSAKNGQLKLKMQNFIM